MKLLSLLLVAGAGSSAALVHTGVLPCPCHVLHGLTSARVAPASALLTAEYIEARDCTVFGGACHVNGEALTQGRSALAAWRFASGGKVVAAIECETNVGAADAAPRLAVLFVDGASDAEVAAAVDAARLTVVARHAIAVAWQRDGDHFHVGVEDVLDLAGEALADRSCCTMPSAVWYHPLASASGAAVREPVVGKPSRCRFVGQDGLVAWRYEDANTAFVGTFEVAPPAP